MRNIVFTCAIFLAAGKLHAGTVITLDPPSGLIQAPAGSTAGWGFSMTSDPAFFVSVIQSGLVGQTNPTLGLYTDFIGSEGGPVSGVLAPGVPTWIESFDNISQGLGAFTIDPGAAPGATDSGSIEIQFATYSADPNTCGTCILGFQTVDLPFQVTVGPDSLTSAPEPSSMWLLLAACALVWLYSQRSAMTGSTRVARRAGT